MSTLECAGCEDSENAPHATDCQQTPRLNPYPPLWRKTTVGTTRQSCTGAAVKITRAWDGGTRVTISRPVQFGKNIYTGEPTYVWRVTHSRTFR